MDGKTKKYYWCPNHHQWTIHKSSECKRQPSKLKKKQAFMKTKKRANYTKKDAFLQGKAAYQPCKYDTSEEEVEIRMLDNDDNSNRLISTYSSEGSNLS
jgi:hypothetical protein